MGFEGVLNQIFQPYFYYSVIFLCVSFVCVKILTKYCNFIGQRTKSLLYLFPLALPLAVMLISFPSTSIQTTYQQVKAITTAASAGMNPFPFGPFPPPAQTIYTVTTATSTVLSVTGVICIIGLIVGGLFALSMVLADDRLARRFLHVIPISPEEHQWLQAKIAESSRKLSIAPPKIGLVEDLRPNAFTIGYGKRATIVFSIGLLNILSKDEIAAVASHELAHVKNNDFFFKTLSNALTTLSFFNPLSYIASSSAQREREMLADERAIELLGTPSTLASALAKICRAIQSLPKESILVNFSSNLLVTSSVLHRVGILATHPRLDTRLRNISAPKSSKHWSSRNTQLALLLSFMLILSAVAVTLAMADLQLNFKAGFANAQYVKSLPTDFKVTGYNWGPANATLLPGVFPPPFNGAQTVHLLVYPSNLGMNAGNAYAATGYVSLGFGQPIPAGGLIVMPRQAPSFVVLQAPSLPPPAWMG